MCEAGVNIKAMQDILGHADVETTLGIYADATKDLKSKEMLGFDEYFKQLTEDDPERKLTTNLRPFYDQL